MSGSIVLLPFLALISSWLFLAKDEFENVGASEIITFTIDTEVFSAAQVIAVSGTSAIGVSAVFLF